MEIYHQKLSFFSAVQNAIENIFMAFIPSFLVFLCQFFITNKFAASEVHPEGINGGEQEKGSKNIGFF
jgi:hypothetical protein